LGKRKSVSGKKERSFEEALGRLEEIVLELEEGELSLEEALEKFEEGIELSQYCMQKLTRAEEKVQKLMKNTKGELTTEQFEVEEDK
jgi:exodeoxyribonuclease VII small subunit